MSFLFLFIYAVIVGLIAKAIHPKDAPVGLLSTLCVGLTGTYIGGVINWVLGFGHQPIERSGLIMGIIGGVIALAIWRWYNLKFSPEGQRSFWNGKLR